ARPADFAMLKVQATRMLEAVAREAAQVLGGASYIKGSKVERIYREVRVNAIGGGSEEIMLDLAGRQLFGGGHK
ncbi:MAG: acyl-CoA dehydrogenase, partial [Alphaproteobacteria bacterium HGW-Alphaproteobacteria-13]